MKDWDHTKMPAVEDAADAVTFYREVFLNLGVNLNPDEGFICAEGRSRFACLTDEQARASEAVNREAIEALRAEHVDAWEIAQDMSMLLTFAHHVKEMRMKNADPRIFTDGLMGHIAERLIPFLDGSGSMMCRAIPRLGDEDDEERAERRSKFVLNKVEELCAGCDIVTSAQSSTHQATAIPADILPPLWAAILERHVARIGEAGVKTAHAMPEGVDAMLQQVMDEDADIDGDIDGDDNDDDPFGWDAEVGA